MTSTPSSGAQHRHFLCPGLFRAIVRVGVGILGLRVFRVWGFMVGADLNMG